MHPPFLDNIWDANLADMQLINKLDIGYKFILCVVDIYSKYVWGIPIIDKKNYNYYCFLKHFR